MRPVMNLRSLLRPVLFLTLSIAMVFVMEETLAWLGFAIMSIFFVMTDIFRVGQNEINNFSMEIEYTLHSAGLLGEYVLDSTESYGLFMKLIDMPIFVDIRVDKFIEQRKRHAIFLFENRGMLEDNLREFLDKNPSYHDKKIEYICIHSKKIDQCNVLWIPDGHTALVGLNFEDYD
jgi:hypothetical protein